MALTLSHRGPSLNAHSVRLFTSGPTCSLPVVEPSAIHQPLGSLSYPSWRTIKFPVPASSSISNLNPSSNPKIDVFETSFDFCDYRGQFIGYFVEAVSSFGELLEGVFHACARRISKWHRNFLSVYSGYEHRPVSSGNPQSRVGRFHNLFRLKRITIHTELDLKISMLRILANKRRI